MRSTLLLMALVGMGSGLVAPACVKALQHKTGKTRVPRHHTHLPSPIGWHDELNPDTSRLWKWDEPLGHADLSIPKRGAIRLRLGDRAQEDFHQGAPYYWASVARYVENDLDQFPVLAVRVTDVTGKGTWWDVIIRGYISGENLGREWHLTLPGNRGGNHPGLLLFDVPPGTDLIGNKRMRMRLNVAGLARGGTADYASIQFVTRGEAEQLAKRPGAQWIHAQP